MTIRILFTVARGYRDKTAMRDIVSLITHGPLAGFTITSGEDLLNDAAGQVAVLHSAGELGYIAPSQEWVDGTGEPLPEAVQLEADQMVRTGLLPEFKEWFA